MTERRPDFQLTSETADQIISLLGESWDEDFKRATPTEISRELGINRRTFNSAISKAIFTKRPTEAQWKLRIHICDILYGEILSVID